MRATSNATWQGALTVRGVEFEAQCAFSFQVHTWTEQHPYGDTTAGEDMSAIEDIDPEPVEARESIYTAALETLIERGARNNARTRKHARYLSRAILRLLSTKSAFTFIDEDELTTAID